MVNARASRERSDKAIDTATCTHDDCDALAGRRLPSALDDAPYPRLTASVARPFLPRYGALGCRACVNTSHGVPIFSVVLAWGAVIACALTQLPCRPWS